jgi:hypothetical protein
MLPEIGKEERALLQKSGQSALGQVGMGFGLSLKSANLRGKALAGQGQSMRWKGALKKELPIVLQ